MRKPRDFDAELKALGDKARDLKSRKVQQLGELVIATGADTLNADELAGALIVLAETKRPERGRHGPGAGPHFFKAGRGEMHRQLTATRTALLRNRAARNRLKPQGRDMTCACGRSSAASARGISSNSAASSLKLVS